MAKYNTNWTKYEYELVRVLESTLQSNSLTNATYKYVSSITPAGATWGLIKDSTTGELFVVIGKGISKVNASTSTISVSTVTIASNYSITSSVKGYVLNTATYNANVTVNSTSKETDVEKSTTVSVPTGTVQTVIRPHLTKEEIEILTKNK